MPAVGNQKMRDIVEVIPHCGTKIQIALELQGKGTAFSFHTVHRDIAAMH